MPLVEALAENRLNKSVKGCDMADQNYEATKCWIKCLGQQEGWWTFSNWGKFCKTHSVPSFYESVKDIEKCVGEAFNILRVNFIQL